MSTYEGEWGKADPEALLAFHKALGAIESVAKTEAADTGRFVIRYANLNNVHAEAQRACEMFGLAVTQVPSTYEGMFAVFTTLVHESGGVVAFPPTCLPMPKDAQALGSATTYLRRYSLVSIFGIAVEDDDGRAATVSAQTAPGRRTEAERMIREVMGNMHADARASFVTDFKEEFGMGLSDLPAAKHGDALTWAREWTYVPPALDSEAAEQESLGV